MLSFVGRPPQPLIADKWGLELVSVADFECSPPALRFELDPFPRLPGPAGAHGGLKIVNKIRGQID